MAKPAQKIEAWSFSRLHDYRSCPRKAKYKHIDKLKEPGNEAMQRGSLIDKMGEDFIMGRLKKCPPELKTFEAEFLELRKRKAICQEQWAFTKDWLETDWFAPDAWCRIKTDVCLFTLESNSVLIVDNKTGKPRDYHKEQVKLYALGGLLKFPKAAVIDTRLWYTDAGLELPEEPSLYTPKDLKSLKAYWERETRAMLSDTRFAPRPSNECRWCFFRKSNGGPCEF